MEIVSGQLDPIYMRQELFEIVNLLRTKGVAQLLVMLGWGSRLDAARLWEEVSVDVDDVESFVYRSESDGIYSLGNADLFLMDRDHTFRFLFCHEADVHLETDNVDLTEEILDQWLQRGYKPSKRGADNKWILHDGL